MNWESAGRDTVLKYCEESCVVSHELFFTDLFVSFGCLYSHAKRLSALVSGRTGQAVEARVGVYAARGATRSEANVRDHVALQWNKRNC